MAATREERLEQWITEALAAAPPLTPQQRASIGAMLGGSSAPAAPVLSPEEWQAHHAAKKLSEYTERLKRELTRCAVCSIPRPGHIAQRLDEFDHPFVELDPQEIADLHRAYADKVAELQVQ